MEATGDVCMIDQGKKLFVWSAGPIAIGLAKVNIDEGFVLNWPHGLLIKDSQ